MKNFIFSGMFFLEDADRKISENGTLRYTNACLKICQYLPLNKEILRIKNTKFSEYCFYMNTNI